MFDCRQSRTNKYARMNTKIGEKRGVHCCPSVSVVHCPISLPCLSVVVHACTAVHSPLLSKHE
jgi:hypothetical protein